MMTQLIVAFLVVSGGIFCFAAGLGVLRLPDLLIRMHASTKAGTLGSGLILVAVAVAFAESTVIARAVAAILFLLLTAPVAAHLIGRAAFRTGVPMIDRTRCEDGVAEALRERAPDQAPD
ncbi:MAG: monovalent cation/H(+) antiporter subunit G [Alphaproteobacteria bacterium]|nr:monovalent cation/H(+) antiporter subunit G [Alphaproteobacteria bacterium]